MSPCFSPFGHISIHSLRMEGDCPRLECVVVIYRISIHSLRMEGDAVSFEPYRRTAISIHSLRMEGDLSFDSSSLM